MNVQESERGFSVIELMVVVTTIGILAFLSMPSLERAHDATRVSAFANDIRQFSAAVETYATVYGQYPPDTPPGQADASLQEYLPLDFMLNDTPIGGQWDVDMNAGAGVTAAVGVGNLTNPDLDLIVRIDFAIDDGNIVTGNFRWFPFGGGRPYLIVED